MDWAYLAMMAVALLCGVAFVAIRNYLGWLKARGNETGVYPERSVGEVLASTLIVGLVWGLAFCVLAVLARAAIAAYLLVVG